MRYKNKLETIVGTFLSEKDASDLYIADESYFRNHGKVVKLGDSEKFDNEELIEVMKEIIRWRFNDEALIKKMMYQVLRDTEELDLAVNIPNSSLRARVNIFKSMGKLSAVLRKIPTDIPKFSSLGFEDLHYDSIIKTLNNREGLVLVTGQTGTGKSTTLASLIAYCNENFEKHIVTIEDPVEFKHEPIKCKMTQREVGRNSDTLSFASGLRASLRQAPDIILVGEMRDPETATSAMHAAQTGHLVFATLHTNSAPETVLRIIDMFPADKEKSVRVSLASSLLMIVSQKLVPNTIGKRELCYEILLNNSAVSSLIIQEPSPEKKILQKMIETQQLGNIPLNYLLVRKLKNGVISNEKALEYSNDKASLISLLKNLEEKGDSIAGSVSSSSDNKSKKGFL